MSAPNMTPASAPGTRADLTLCLSPRVLRLLTDYRLWSGGQPQGELAAVLTGVPSWQGGDPDWAFFKPAALEHLAALRAFADRFHQDMRAAGCKQTDSAAAAQWKRRLREQAGRICGTATRAAPRVQTVVIRQDLAPLFPQAPAQGPDRSTYEQRVWAALKDFVDFTQTTAYIEKSLARQGGAA